MLSWTLLLMQLTSIAGGAPDPADAFSRPLGLPLLQTGENDVARLLGSGAPNGHEPFICYVAPANDVFLRFLLDGYPRTNRRVSGFTMRELSGATAAPCAVLGSVVEERARLSVGGLVLGMPRDEVIQLLAPDHESPGGDVFRHFIGIVTLTDEQRALVPRSTRDFPEDGSVERHVLVSAGFRDDKLTEVDVKASWRMLPPAP
jgi:hypothetical protein